MSYGNISLMYADVPTLAKSTANHYRKALHTVLRRATYGISSYRSSEGKTVKSKTIYLKCMTYIGAKKLKDVPKSTTFVNSVEI